MRLKASFKTKKVPLSNQFMMVSYIKTALSSSDIELFKKLYLYGDKRNKRIKPIAFAVFLRGFKINGDIIDIEDGIDITITTPDYNIGVSIYNGILMNRKFKYKEFELELENVSLVQEKNLANSNMIFKTISPIFIKDENGKQITIDSELFEEKLNYISNIYLESYRGYGLKEYLSFIPIEMKKTVVKEEIKEFKENTGKKYFYINAYKGIFKLEGDLEDIDLLLKSGIGFRRSQGYGVFEAF